MASVDSWSDSDLFIALGLLGAALLPVGLDLLVHGLGRCLERAPGATEPVPPKLFGSEAYAALFLTVCVGGPLVLLVVLSAGTRVDDPEEGTATVTAAGCGGEIGSPRGCRDLVALEYEVDGIHYTQVTDDVGFDFTPGDEARVAWDADDPSLVRVEGVR
ncbi:hypothetical protein [Nocardiopsis protaetiae]|uniref:hypothetical protein n=3 Tax=Nocardiopsis protaetiae TaxID=3382270 RepID=UPI00387AECFA